MAREVAEAEARRFGRAAGLLSIGVGSAGLLTYVYFSLASHILDRVDYGEVVVLWSAVFITISTLFRPVEQLLSRTIAERQAREQPIGQPLRVAATIQLAVAAAFAVCALALRDPLQDQLLSGNETLYWILVAAVLAFGASFFARGFLAGSRRFTLYALLLLAESTARVSFALAVAVGIASGQTAVALGIVAAPAAQPHGRPARLCASSRGSEPRRAGAVSAGIGPARVHSRRGRRLRRRRAGDHDQRAEPPERRAPAGQGLRGSGRGGLHLQRADDRPRPARPLPGGGHQPPPAPDAIALQRGRARRGGLPALGPDDDRRDCGLRGCGGADRVDRRSAADAARLRQEVRLRPRRAPDRHRGHGLLPLVRDPEPGGAGAGPGPPRRRLLGWLRARLHRLEPVAGAGRVPPRRGRIRRRGGAALRAPLPALPPPASAPGGCRRARLAARARGAAWPQPTKRAEPG